MTGSRMYQIVSAVRLDIDGVGKKVQVVQKCAKAIHKKSERIAVNR